MSRLFLVFLFFIGSLDLHYNHAQEKVVMKISQKKRLNDKNLDEFSSQELDV